MRQEIEIINCALDYFLKANTFKTRKETSYSYTDFTCRIKFNSNKTIDSLLLENTLNYDVLIFFNFVFYPSSPYVVVNDYTHKNLDIIKILDACNYGDASEEEKFQISTTIDPDTLDVYNLIHKIIKYSGTAYETF